MIWKAKRVESAWASILHWLVLLLRGRWLLGSLARSGPRRVLADTAARFPHPLQTVPPGNCRARGHLHVHQPWQGWPSRRPWGAHGWLRVTRHGTKPGDAEGQGCVLQSWLRGATRHGPSPRGRRSGQGCVVRTVAGHGLCLVGLSCGKGGFRGGAGRPLGSSAQGARPGPWLVLYVLSTRQTKRSSDAQIPQSVQTVS